MVSRARQARHTPPGVIASTRLRRSQVLGHGFAGEDAQGSVGGPAHPDNLRSGPATSYEVLTAVPAGFTVTVHSYANGWSCVTWGDPTGYISNSLINGLPTADGGKGGSSSGSTAGTSRYGGHDYSNVYDYSYYRSQNADLRAAFGNAANACLPHFVDYGMAEGRQGRASFNVYTYRDVLPELWEKFGDNLRGYYLWACGIPQ